MTRGFSSIDVKEAVVIFSRHEISQDNPSVHDCQEDVQDKGVSHALIFKSVFLFSGHDVSSQCSWFRVY